MNKEEIINNIKFMRSAANMQDKRMEFFPDFSHEKTREHIETYCDVQQGFIEELRNMIRDSNIT